MSRTRAMLLILKDPMSAPIPKHCLLSPLMASLGKFQEDFQEDLPGSAEPQSATYNALVSSGHPCTTVPDLRE